MVWYGMVWHGMVWYGMVWYGMVWYGMVWYGMVGSSAHSGLVAHTVLDVREHSVLRVSTDFSGNPRQPAPCRLILKAEDPMTRCELQVSANCSAA